MDTPANMMQILHQVKAAKLNKTPYVKLFEDAGYHERQHEFLFFIKPEIFQGGEEHHLKLVFELLLREFSRFGFSICDIRILGSSYLEKHDIIAQHYGVINSLSREPLKAFTDEAKRRFSDVYGHEPDEVKVLGSLQFLKLYPSFTPDSLQEVWQRSATTKLSGGNYCARVNAGNEEVYLINGFHPKQLLHFTAQGRMIMPVKLAGDLDWTVARNSFIGKTNPADAEPGSLRNELLVNRDIFGLNEVSSSQNGFHLSAGPLEGLVELMRYGSDYSTGDIKRPEDFTFGRQLLEVFSEEKTGLLCSNPIVKYKGNQISTFDLTEEKNSRDAIEMLKQCDLSGV